MSTIYPLIPTIYKKTNNSHQLVDIKELFVPKNGPKDIIYFKDKISESYYPIFNQIKDCPLIVQKINDPSSLTPLSTSDDDKIFYTITIKHSTETFSNLSFILKLKVNDNEYATHIFQSNISPLTFKKISTLENKFQNINEINLYLQLSENLNFNLLISHKNEDINNIIKYRENSYTEDIIHDLNSFKFNKHETIQFSSSAHNQENIRFSASFFEESSDDYLTLTLINDRIALKYIPKSSPSKLFLFNSQIKLYIDNCFFVIKQINFSNLCQEIFYPPDLPNEQSMFHLSTHSTILSCNELSNLINKNYQNIIDRFSNQDFSLFKDLEDFFSRSFFIQEINGRKILYKFLGGRSLSFYRSFTIYQNKENFIPVGELIYANNSFDHIILFNQDETKDYASSWHPFQKVITLFNKYNSVLSFGLTQLSDYDDIQIFFNTIMDNISNNQEKILQLLQEDLINLKQNEMFLLH